MYGFITRTRLDSPFLSIINSKVPHVLIIMTPRFRSKSFWKASLCIALPLIVQVTLRYTIARQGRSLFGNDCPTNERHLAILFEPFKLLQNMGPSSYFSIFKRRVVKLHH